MAAAITTTSTTLEGQALEVARALQQAELAVTPATARPNRITLTPNLEDGEITIALTLPISMGGTGNSLAIQANPYLA